MGFGENRLMQTSERATQYPGGYVDDRDNLLIRHTGGTDDTDHADALAISLIGSRHHAAIGECAIPRLFTDKDVDTAGPHAFIEQT